MEQLFTPATLAKRWECSERHVRNLIAQGKLGYFRLGEKLIKIKASDVEAFESQTQNAQPAAIRSVQVTKPDPVRRVRIDLLRRNQGLVDST